MADEERNISKYAAGGVTDKKGNPAEKSKTGGWLASSIILGSELSERMCVIGISSNLVTYLGGVLHLSNAESANIVTNFMGTLYLLCLLGGFLADSFLGRFKTIATFGAIQTVGVGILALASSLNSLQPPPCYDHHKTCVRPGGTTMALLYTALYLVALGAGGVKSNVSGLGSDQFDVEDPKEEKQMVYFFTRFYFCISLGSLFAVTVLVYIQDDVSRGWGYGIPAGSMGFSVLLLLAFSHVYRYRKPAGSPIVKIAQVLSAAWANRKKPMPSDPSLLNQDAENQKVGRTHQFRCLDKAAIVDPAKEPAKQSAWKLSTMTNVEEVKMVVRLLPIWSTCIMFWTVYSQMLTFSVEQADTMDRRTGPIKIPAASLHVFVVVGIMLCTSLSEKVAVPIARRLTGRLQGITSLQRIATGLVFSMIAMVFAGFIEHKRLTVAEQHGLLDRRSATVPLSVYWLVPQFFFVGFGEGFAYVGQLEFFIKEAPVSMKSMSTGLFLSTLSMGFFFSSILVTLVNKVTGRGGALGWLPDILNRGRLDYFYWLLAILCFFNFLIFLLFSKRYRYKDDLDVFNSDNSCEKPKQGFEETKTLEDDKELDVFYVEV